MFGLQELLCQINQSFALDIFRLEEDQIVKPFDLTKVVSCFLENSFESAVRLGFNYRESCHARNILERFDVAQQYGCKLNWAEA